MKMSDIAFGTTDWSQIERSEHPGECGVASWRTQSFGAVRVRMVEYTAGYVADNAEPHRSSTKVGARLFIVD